MKNILLLLVLVIGCRTANAQYVTIPDSNFRNFLRTNYPACMNAGGQLDTTCTSLLAATQLSVRYNTISNLEGVQYFKNITMLNCMDVSLTMIPKFPSSLTVLWASNNLLTTLPALPANMQTLYVDQNRLTSIPVLPSTMHDLDVAYNQLTSLPDLPNLYRLNCNNNRLISLPTLPSTLELLTASFNTDLSCFPTPVPSGLLPVDIIQTSITCLPTGLSARDTILPFCTSGCYLNFNENYKYIPDVSFRSYLTTQYPSSMNNGFLNINSNDVFFANYLIVRNLGIASLEGAQYFNHVTLLDCSDNQISSLPSPLSVNLQTLKCNNNPAINCLPSLPTSVTTLYVSNTALVCLPNDLPDLTNTDVSLPVCTSPCVYEPNFVTIPDANFRAALKAKFPACFNANDRMDTTCSGILNAVSLNVNNKNIGSIQGIQYFKKLFVLNCDSNNITTIPHINDTLYGLFCSHNRITSISTLPRNLKDLDCSYNQLTALPSIDKVSNSLDCSNNPSLSCLPTLFSNVFQGIKIRNTAITCFPNAFGGDADTTLPFCNTTCAYIPNLHFVTIPDTNFRNALRVLYPSCFNASGMLDTTCTAFMNPNAANLNVNNKNISSLEGIRYFKYLRSLSCDSNQISSINHLPPILYSLNCSYNRLTSLPVLPSFFAVLICNHNQLTSLPVLPGTIYRLDFSYNQINSVMQSFRDSMSYFFCNNNPLSCLPLFSRPQTVNLRVKNTGVTCLPYSFYTTDTILPICSSTFNICPVNPFVQGKIYNDLDNNNIYNAGEQLIAQQIIKVTPNNWLAASSVNGIYFVKLDTAINNTWSAVNNYRYATITPSSYSLENIHNLGLQGGSYDFGVHLITNVKDLETTLGSSPARPGFTTNITVTANNVGTVNQSNITIKLKKPNGYNVVSSSVVPSSTLNDTLIWNNININYLAHQSIHVQLQVPINAVLGDSAVYEAWSNGTQGDSTPIDNYTKWTEIIRGSFDPNDKLVNKTTLPPTYNAEKDRLLYTIRFQNTGTDTAFTVIIRDIIPDNLDVSSLRVVNASHSYQLIVREKNIVEVAFPNIQLPDSNVNEAKSHGFVQLEFKPKAGLPVNAEINNNASIFFDYNAPIVTNTATTKIQITTGIASNKKLAFKLFPNPATSIITVELPFEGNGKWYLMDISGKSIQQNTIENNLRTFDINVNNVSSGTYLLTLEINGIISTSKVAILK
ncbi:MAG TPA: T9SS type A sorting domain-containing protein [Chitinophagales bacterium]|nr:T9SS type A sorting domain-containing protein [Chitinophagales bacterium]